MAQRTRTVSARPVRRAAPSTPAPSAAAGLQRTGWGFLYSTWRLYTSATPPVAVTPAVGELLLFSNAYGDAGVMGFAAGVVLTESQTNMVAQARMPAEQGFRATHLGIGFNPGVPALAQTELCWNTTIRWVFPEFQKDIGKAILWPLPIGFSGANNTPGLEIGGMVQPSPGNMRKLGSPVELPRNKTFRVGLRFHAGFAPVIAAAWQIAAQPVDVLIALFGRWDSRI